MLNVWCGPLTESMQTNTVIIVQKTSKGDVSGNTACTPLGSTYITSTGGKITVRSPLGNQSPEDLVSWMPILPCLPFVPCFHLIVLPWDCRKVLYACLCSFLLPYMYTPPAVLLLPPYLLPLVSLIPFYLPASNIALNLVLGYTKP